MRTEVLQDPQKNREKRKDTQRDTARGSTHFTDGIGVCGDPDTCAVIELNHLEPSFFRTPVP